MPLRILNKNKTTYATSSVGLVNGYAEMAIATVEGTTEGLISQSFRSYVISDPNRKNLSSSKIEIIVTAT